jgi:hypothetical protein
MHALERAIEMKGTGQYSHHCRVTDVIHAYLKWQKEKLERGLYEDVAYIEGYINGLTYLLMSKDGRESVRVPMYFMFGVKADIDTAPDFAAQLKRNPNAH